MPKHVFKIGSAAAEADLQPFADVEKPPPGIYTVALKKFRLKKNKNGDFMLNTLSEIREVGEKASANGYGIWNNLNITDQGAPFVNNLLDVLGAERKTFWSDGCVTDNEDPANVLKIGKKRFDAGEVMFRVATADEPYQGQTRLSVKRYLPLKPEGNADATPDLEELSEEELEFVDEAASDESESEEAEEAVESGVDEEAPEPVSDEELAEMSLEELKELADSWSVPYTARATEKSLRKILHDAQEPDEAAESTALVDEIMSDEDESYTAENLAEQDPAELKRILTEEFEKPLPKPPIKTRIIKAILQAQEEALGESTNEPPF